MWKGDEGEKETNDSTWNWNRRLPTAPSNIWWGGGNCSSREQSSRKSGGPTFLPREDDEKMQGI